MFLKLFYIGENAYPDEACESVLVNGISVLLAILETRRAVNNSFVTNDYLDPSGTGKNFGSALQGDSRTPL